jgi:hypothetical protein
MSAEAPWLAYTSLSAEMATSDANASTDVSIRDLMTGSNHLANGRSVGLGTGSGASFDPIFILTRRTGAPSSVPAI